MRRDDIELPSAPTNDRPNASYRCGATCSGTGNISRYCPLGPTVSGICRSDKESCKPERTSTSIASNFKRALLVIGLFVLITGAYFGKQDFFKPGALSTPHAQILAGKMTSDSCAACHPKAGNSPVAWFLSGHDANETLQSDRCMDCHHTTMPREFARSAHNLSAEELAQVRESTASIKSVSWNRWLPRPEFNETNVACSACHREHAGANASLTSLSNEQCQTCHQNRFTDFATDHPSWNNWPYSTNEPIAFDHLSHSQRHFPGTRDAKGIEEKFDCLQCHAKNDTGEFTRITTYEVACSRCHDKALNQRTGERLDLVVLPSLIEPDTKVVGNWPPEATGFYDGKVGPLTRLLLTRNDYSAALAALPGNGDFVRVNPNDPHQRQSAETIAVAIRDLVFAMATQGPIPASARTQVEHPEVREILKGLPPQLMWDASQRWFRSPRLTSAINAPGPQSPSSFKVASARDLSPKHELLSDQGKDPLESEDPLKMEDPLSEKSNRVSDSLPVSKEMPSRLAAPLEHDPVAMQPDGGWYIDDSRMAVSYRGHGHADPVLKAAIELAAGLSEDNSIRRELLGSGPALACIECHRGANTSGGFTWEPSGSIERIKGRFTKFSHLPHMNLPSLADCKYCHRMNDEFRGGIELNQATTVSMSDLNRHAGTHHDFEPIARHACASCHTANAAGDACIKCHLYHR